MRILPVVAYATLLALATPALADPAHTAKAKNDETVLQAPDGRSLYVFDDDKPGVSNCSGECLKLWPPFLVSGSEKPMGDWSVVDRGDGQKQWAYKGRPLYLFARDTQPGQTQGKSFNGNKWHVAKP